MQSQHLDRGPAAASDPARSSGPSPRLSKRVWSLMDQLTELTEAADPEEVAWIAARAVQAADDLNQIASDSGEIRNRRLLALGLLAEMQLLAACTSPTDLRYILYRLNQTANDLVFTAGTAGEAQRRRLAQQLVTPSGYRLPDAA